MIEDTQSGDETRAYVTQNGLVLARIDHYELVRELGGGGFAAVYLARDTISGVEYAVKGLPPFVKNNQEELESIKANFALVSRLSHTNIARAHVLHQARDVRYGSEDVRRKLRVDPGDMLMVMEFAPGVTLSQWQRLCPDRKVPMAQALDVARQIASALDYAHEQKILHRDVKPANVMIETRQDGNLMARVLDFGLAAEIRTSMGRVSREIHDTSGTRPYMAPEQWLGGKQGPATDQYALAVLFHELITGEVPFSSVFETGDPVVMMNVVGREPFLAPADLPKTVRLALEKSLAKKPEERFANCGEFVGALEGTVGNPHKGELSQRRGWRKWLLLAMALFVLLGVAGGVWLYFCKERQMRESIAAQDEARRVQREAEAEKNKAMQKDKAVELRERMRLAYEDAAKTGFSSDAAFAEMYREFECYYGAGMESYKNEDYGSAVNFFERANSHMQLMVSERRDKEEERERQERNRKFEAKIQFLRAWGDRQFDTAAQLVDSLDHEDATVLYYLGDMYEGGKGVPKDEAVAAKLYRKAAEQGDASAQFAIGLMHETGRGVAMDAAEAMRWYRKAAAQGDARAQCNIGVLYANGSGVTKDVATAMRWYRKAAEQGNETAQFNIGVLYENGDGVVKDEAEAAMWYRKAAKQGYESAKKALDELNKKQRQQSRGRRD